jgi:ubiquinone/menaquinone biosynthesis C-methylase UbiE
MLKVFNSPRTTLSLPRKKQSIRNLILWGALALTINSVHAMDSEDKEKDTYALQTGEKGAKRLTKQNKFLKEFSEEHLKKAGLSKGQTVVELGCGNAVMTPSLAKNARIVYAVDKSEKQLNEARKTIKAEGVENVIFILGDAQSLENLPIPNSDIAFIRLLTMHVPNPKAVIKGVKTLLKPGGVLCIEEPIMSSSIHTNLPGYIEALVKLGTENSVDYNIGNRLVSLCEEEGFSCTVEEHRPVMTPHQAKMSHLMGLEEWGPVALQKKIIQPGQIEEWKGIINSWSDAEEGDTASYYTPPRMVYVTATKKE